MTSNLGSNIIMEWTQNMNDANRDEVMEAVRIKLFDLLKQTIRPEFLNRIDEIIMFKPLSREDIVQIVDLQLRQVQTLVKAKNITLTVADSAKAWLAKAGYDLQFGARPLKRIIQKHVVNLLSEKLLAGEITEGDSISVEIGTDGSVQFIPVLKGEVIR
jgi:ATP-dependent Clp protease ATP-binding subunit ClpB